jgi:hypothetical protein
MKRQRFYLETTLFDYYFNDESDYHLATVKLFENIGQRLNFGYISDVVDYELQNAPEPKRSGMLGLINKFNLIILDTNEEILNLANLYIKDGIFSEKSRYEACHIASASVHNVNYLMSFNFKHINNIRIENRASLVNLREGYGPISFSMPMEVLDDEE